MTQITQTETVFIDIHLNEEDSAAVRGFRTGDSLRRVPLGGWCLTRGGDLHLDQKFLALLFDSTASDYMYDPASRDSAIVFALRSQYYLQGSQRLVRVGDVFTFRQGEQTIHLSVDSSGFSIVEI